MSLSLNSNDLRIDETDNDNENEGEGMFAYIQSLERDYQELTRQIKREENETELLRNRLTTISAERTKLREEAQHHVRNTCSVKQNLLEVEAEHTSAMDILTTAKQNFSNLQESESNLWTEQDKILEKQKIALRELCSKFRSMIHDIVFSQLESDVANLRSNVIEAEAELKSMEKDQQEIQQIQMQIDELETTLIDQQKQIVEMQVKLDKLTEELLKVSDNGDTGGIANVNDAVLDAKLITLEEEEREQSEIKVALQAKLDSQLRTESMLNQRINEMEQKIAIFDQRIQVQSLQNQKQNLNHNPQTVMRNNRYRSMAPVTFGNTSNTNIDIDKGKEKSTKKKKNGNGNTNTTARILFYGNEEDEIVDVDDGDDDDDFISLQKAPRTKARAKRAHVTGLVKRKKGKMHTVGAQSKQPVEIEVAVQSEAAAKIAESEKSKSEAPLKVNNEISTPDTVPKDIEVKERESENVFALDNAQEQAVIELVDDDTPIQVQPQPEASEGKAASPAANPLPEVVDLEAEAVLADVDMHMHTAAEPVSVNKLYNSKSERHRPRFSTLVFYDGSSPSQHSEGDNPFLSDSDSDLQQPAFIV